MKGIMRLSLIAALVAVASGPSDLRAAKACPAIISNGVMACHRMTCEGCVNAWYNCDDNWDYNFGVCGL